MRNLFRSLNSKLYFILFLVLACLPVFAQSQTNIGLPGVSVNLGGGVDLVNTLQILLLFTVLTLAPAILLLCTGFTRIIIVLSFLRQALGTQNLPPNQMLVGLALFLSTFVMYPTAESIYKNALDPYMKKKISLESSLQLIESDLRIFMTKQIRKEDIQLFYEATSTSLPDTVADVPFHFLVPSFIISELKTAFKIGFLIYVPFLILDMVVASVLMAMGMMMLPPVMVSFPFKLLIFVLVDGWNLITGSILRSFH